MRLAETTLCGWEENDYVYYSKQDSRIQEPLFLTPVPGISSSVTDGQASEMRHLER